MQKRTKKNNIIIAVGSLIINDENELLLIKAKGKFEDQWIVPGGKITFGETLIDALKREIKEETNIKVYDIKFLGVQEYIPSSDKHYVFIQFICYANKDQKIILNREASQYGWFKKKDLSKIKIAPPTMNLINTYLLPLNII